MSAKIYLRSYDSHSQYLEYGVEDGSFLLLNQKQFEQMGAKKRFGTFTLENGQAFGVYRSEKGPVVFCNQQRVFGQFGATRAEVEEDVSSPFNRFALFDSGKQICSTFYKKRSGVGANPYDTEAEDVDFFVMLTKGLQKEQFFRNYTASSLIAGKEV